MGHFLQSERQDITENAPGEAEFQDKGEGDESDDRKNRRNDGVLQVLSNVDDRGHKNHKSEQKSIVSSAEYPSAYIRV
jgi:hypothetical protein